MAALRRCAMLLLFLVSSLLISIAAAVAASISAPPSASSAAAAAFAVVRLTERSVLLPTVNRRRSEVWTFRRQLSRTSDAVRALNPTPHRRRPTFTSMGAAAAAARFYAAAGSGAVAAASPQSSRGLLSFGGIVPVMSNIFLRPDKVEAVVGAVSKAADVADLVQLGLLGYAVVPAARVAHRLFRSDERGHGGREARGERRRYVAAEEGMEGEITEDMFAGGEAEGRGAAAVGAAEGFEGTFLYGAVDNLSQAARVGGLVYGAHLLLVALDALGVKWARNYPSLSRASARVIYTVWIALRVRYFKRRALAAAVSRAPDALGRARVYDRIFDYIIYGVSGMFLLDTVGMSVGSGMQSVFAVGGIGSLVFGLASKELAAQLVSGLTLSTSEKFFDGDKIRLGDGTVGKVLKIGAIETQIRGPDELITCIPNTQIANQRVSNLSRLELSSVKQTLRFSYDDVKKLPIVLREIKYEIQRLCPRLIVDGTRPFRAHWRDYKTDCVECVVQCHFRIPPNGDEYWDNRQTVLQAIAKAAEKHGVKFAVPTSYNMNKSINP